MRVSNEPCVDEKNCRRCELARKRLKDFSDTYGECRDSNISFGAVQTPCVCEPVGKANCVPTESTTGRKTVIYRLRAELLQIEEILYKIGRNLHGRRGDVRIAVQQDRKRCSRGSKVGADGE